MSDNPVQRWHAHNPAATPTHADLKKGAAYAAGFADGHKQADRIEALTAELATCEKYRDAYAECDRIGTQAVRDLEAKLAKAVEALREIAGECGCSTARVTLAEIEGEKG
jgi:enhancing lycopene biosynthesis protein 2